MGWQKGESTKLDTAAVIHATTFSTSYNALWRSIAPTCELYVRRLNMSGLEQIERPMLESIEPGRSALISEFAFSMFVALASNLLKGKSSLENKELRAEAWNQTKSRLSAFSTHDVGELSDLSEDEMKYADEVCARQYRFFRARGKKIALRPIFLGCGFIEASEGDVIVDDTIYEVKTVERAIRSSDIRQLITYAALNYASQQYAIDKIGIFNPRRGTACEVNLEHACDEISGRSALDLFWQITSAISSGEISR